MGSGKYGAVSGMISRMQMMENISEQLASAQVRAYKKGTPTFQAKLAEASSGMATKGVNYVKTTGETIDFSPGQLEFTGGSLHLALNGDGFFPGST
jgi:flagellar basal body rod protein FlgG